MVSIGKRFRDVLLTALLLATATLAAVVENSRQNFIIIFTDDQGYGDLSCYGGNHVSTPCIDQMATEARS